MKPDQERVRNLLTDTVTLLCKNGLQYQTELRVQGVLGITLDNNDVFIVHINEKFGDAIGGALTIRSDEGDAAKTLLGGTRLDVRKAHDASRDDTPIAMNSKTGEALHRRRRRSRESSASPALLTNSKQQQILQRPIKRLMPSNNAVRNRSTGHNSMGADSTIPGTDDVVDVKIKTEDDVILVEQSENDKAEMSGAASQDIPRTTDQSAMQESYPNLSLSELQGSYQPFGEILGVTDSSTNSGADGTAPPPTKRRATSGNTQDSFGGSSEMAPTSDAGGPFITGIIQNETMTGNVAPHTTAATSWDPSQMPDLSSLTPQDGQMILDSTPGCSAWDTSQQSQVSAAATATSTHSISDQSSESIRHKYPQDKLYGKAIMRIISQRIVEPVRSFGDHVHACRVIWRGGSDRLAYAWDNIVSQRHLCDRIVARTPSLQMFVSCISGMYNTGRALQEEVNPVSPAISYWAVFGGATARASFEIHEHLLAACPTAQVKPIKSLRVRQDDESEAAYCGTLFITLKDHNSDFVDHKIRRSLVACGASGLSPQSSNATMFVMRHSKYFQDMQQSLPELNEAGLCIGLEVFDVD